MTLIFNEIKTPAQVSEINSLCASQSVAYNDFQEHILRTTIGYIFVETYHCLKRLVRKLSAETSTLFQQKMYHSYFNHITLEITFQ